jgi:hypothetical protein
VLAGNLKIEVKEMETTKIYRVLRKYSGCKAHAIEGEFKVKEEAYNCLNTCEKTAQERGWNIQFYIVELYKNI